MNTTCNVCRLTTIPRLIVPCTGAPGHVMPHQGLLGNYVVTWDDRDYLTIASLRDEESS